MGSSRLAAAAAALILALASCNTHPDIKTETVVDPKTNLAGYKTFAWLGSVAELRDPNRDWTPVGFDIQREVQFLVEAQLRDHGMEYAAGEPDAYVADIVLVNMDSDAEMIKKMFGDKADTTNLQAGALIVALIDAQTHEAVWAGAAIAQGRKERTDAQAKERLAAAVDKIFRGFPR